MTLAASADRGPAMAAQGSNRSRLRRSVPPLRLAWKRRAALLHQAEADSAAIPVAKAADVPRAEILAAETLVVTTTAAATGAAATVAMEATAASSPDPFKFPQAR